jgi:hypothetical protein
MLYLMMNLYTLKRDEKGPVSVRDFLVAQYQQKSVGSGDRCFGICFIWGILSSCAHMHLVAIC